MFLKWIIWEHFLIGTEINWDFQRESKFVEDWYKSRGKEGGFNFSLRCDLCYITTVYYKITNNKEININCVDKTKIVCKPVNMWCYNKKILCSMCICVRARTHMYTCVCVCFECGHTSASILEYSWENICVKYYCDWKIQIEEYERIEKDLIKTNAFVFLYKSEMTVVVL